MTRIGISYSCLVICALHCAGAFAGEVISTEPQMRGPYCGVYCGLAVLTHYARSVEPGALINERYLDSPEGSTLDGLERLFGDYGIHSQALGKLTPKLLERSGLPAVLHVKPDNTSQKFQHYILLLSLQDDKALLFDPPNAPYIASFREEILPRWGGIAMLVSDKPFVAPRPDPGEILLIMLLAAMVLCGLYLIPDLKRKSHGVFSVLHPVASQVVALVFLTTVASLVFHAVRPEGLIANAAGVARLQHDKLDKLLPEITASELKAAQYAGAVIVDARQQNDYVNGHISGAINLTPSASNEEVGKVLSGYSKETPIVVYCQSSGCGYAGVIAKKAYALGFQKILHYKQGWIDWETSNSGEVQ